MADEVAWRMGNCESKGMLRKTSPSCHPEVADREPSFDFKFMKLGLAISAGNLISQQRVCIEIVRHMLATSETWRVLESSGQKPDSSL